MNARAAIALLSAAFLAVPALARDIPAALLAHEAKVRASLTPAQSQHVASLATRLTPTMGVPDVLALGRGEPDANIFLVLLEYQKLLNKEAREDKKQARESKQLSMQAKAGKLALDNKSIDANMREAEQKATNLMNAATAAMTTGVVAGGLQTVGGARVAPTHTPTPAPVSHGIGATRK